MPRHATPPLGLAHALDQIDALGLPPLARTVFRAAACRNHGDEIGEARELGRALAAAADLAGLAPRDADRIVLTAVQQLRRAERCAN